MSDKFIAKADKFRDKVIAKANKILEYLDLKKQQLDNLVDAFFSIIKKVVISIYIIISSITHAIYDFLWISHGKKIRMLSMPWGKIVIVLHDIFIKNKMGYPIFEEGMHQVRAKIGGGKSLTSFILAQIALRETGLPSYFHSPVEKPKLSEDGKYWYVNHRVIKNEDYYKDGKIIMRKNYKKYPMEHKDERHLEFNPRMNKTKEYNERWLPEHQDELVMRHNGARVIIKYSQHAKLDYQEMETLQYTHEVETIKGLPLFRWVDTGNFNKIPTKIKFLTYKLLFEFDGTVKRKLHKKWHLKVLLSDLNQYDTHAEGYRTKHLKLDYQ